jgi:hypothetical protein
MISIVLGHADKFYVDTVVLNAIEMMLEMAGMPGGKQWLITEK